MWPSNITIEEETDPVTIARVRETLEHFGRNSDWLATHWSDLLPQARGKFIAVAGQEAFVADSLDEAWEWVTKTHPVDKGPLVRFVFAGKGPRMYAGKWNVDAV